MIDKQIKEDICPYQGECSINGCKRNNDDCFIKQLFEERYKAEKQIIKLNKTIKTKEQENEELRQYHNKCCEENAKKLEEWLEKYNQVSRDFHNGKYCNEENCNLLKAKEQECERWKKANDDKNKLLSKLGCPTTATARRQEFVLQQQIDQLKEELKGQTCGLRPELKRLINKICRKYDIEAKTYHEKIVEIIHSLDGYNQALIDIEEILKQGIKIHDDIIVSKQILQKAREVENE